MSNQIAAIGKLMVGALTTEYIKDLETNVNKHKTCRERISENVSEEYKAKLVKFLEGREILFKLLLVLWKQIRSDNPNKELITKLLERYDEKAGEFLEFSLEMSLEDNIADNDYLYDCNLFKTERDRIRQLLTISGLM